MKRIVLFFFLLAGLNAGAQITCTVTPADTIACYKDSIAFTAHVHAAGTILYQWMKNSQIIPFATDTVYVIPSVNSADTGFYRCIATRGTDIDTSNFAHLRMHPKLRIDTLYRYNALDCPQKCNGQFKVHVSGGTPPYIYEYLWGGGKSQDTIVFGLCHQKYTFTVIDSVSQYKLSQDYYVDALKLPKITMEVKPGDTIYVSNPVVTVSFPDSAKQYLSNWKWDFGDSTKIQNTNPQTHSYGESFLENTITNSKGQFYIKLDYTDLNSCDTTIEYLMIVKAVKLKIPNVFTPNGDGRNDEFLIQIEGNPTRDYRDAYFNTQLVVFDRWGKKVFEKNNYQSGDWKGERLSDGTYFYILKCTGQFGTDVFRGSVTILTSSQ